MIPLLAHFSWIGADGREHTPAQLSPAGREELVELVTAAEAIEDDDARRRALVERIEAGASEPVRMVARYLLWRQLWIEIWPLAFSDAPAPDFTMRNPGGMQ